MASLLLRSIQALADEDHIGGDRGENSALVSIGLDRRGFRIQSAVSGNEEEMRDLIPLRMRDYGQMMPAEAIAFMQVSSPYRHLTYLLELLSQEEIRVLSDIVGDIDGYTNGQGDRVLRLAEELLQHFTGDAFMGLLGTIDSPRPIVAAYVDDGDQLLSHMETLVGRLGDDARLTSYGYQGHGVMRLDLIIAEVRFQDIVSIWYALADGCLVMTLDLPTICQALDALDGRIESLETLSSLSKLRRDMEGQGHTLIYVDMVRALDFAGPILHELDGVSEILQMLVEHFSEVSVYSCIEESYVYGHIELTRAGSPGTPVEKRIKEQ